MARTQLSTRSVVPWSSSDAGRSSASALAASGAAVNPFIQVGSTATLADAANDAPHAASVPSAERHTRHVHDRACFVLPAGRFMHAWQGVAYALALYLVLTTSFRIAFEWSSAADGFCFYLDFLVDAFVRPTCGCTFARRVLSMGM